MTHLYNYIELYAYEKKLQRLYVEASFMMQPFFEKRGFRTIREKYIGKEWVYPYQLFNGENTTQLNSHLYLLQLIVKHWYHCRSQGSELYF